MNTSETSCRRAGRGLLWPIVLVAQLCPQPLRSSTPDANSNITRVDLQTEQFQACERLGVTGWQRAGYRGRGLKVAVLDSGFRGYRAHLGKALPVQVATCSFRNDGDLEARDSQHGVLCAEVIHALAPEAELLLANWEPDQPARFLDAVRWARTRGARILSCSMIMPTWSDGDGGGGIHAELARLLGSGEREDDLLFFASAGNTARRHWCGCFRDAGNGLHAWEGSRTENILKPFCDERLSVQLCCGPSSAYELIVHDLTGDQTVGRATTTMDRTHAGAIVDFQAEPGHTYAAQVRLLSGCGDAFHLVVLGGSLKIATRTGSIPFPGDGSEVIAVGAVDAAGHRLAYSSCGTPTSAKPDVVARVPFPSLWRLCPFAGTSAAAPQAAALAALLWTRYPTWTAGRVRQTLYASACGGAQDGETGHGCVHLP